MNIETNRLNLIPVSQEHILEIFQNFNEQIITYMLPSVAKDINETKEVVERFSSQREQGTDYVYAITLNSKYALPSIEAGVLSNYKINGEFIGIVGLHNLVSETPELGVWIKQQSHGNHFGREAVGGVIAYAKSLGIEKLCYPVDRRNIPSKKIALFYNGRLRPGYIEVGTADGRVLEEEIYDIEIKV